MKKFKNLVFIDDDYPTNYYHRVIALEAEIADNLTFFQNAREALDYLISLQHKSQQPPEIIFLDINMPGMNGWEFTEAYKENLGSAASEIWILTTSINPNDKRMADHNSLISGFLSKPLTVEIFNDLRKKHL